MRDWLRRLGDELLHLLDAVSDRLESSTGADRDRQCYTEAHTAADRDREWCLGHAAGHTEALHQLGLEPIRHREPHVGCPWCPDTVVTPNVPGDAIPVRLSRGHAWVRPEAMPYVRGLLPDYDLHPLAASPDGTVVGYYPGGVADGTVIRPGLGPFACIRPDHHHEQETRP